MAAKEIKLKINVVTVTRSFGTLNEGERFTAQADDEWVRRHVDAGVLKVEQPREVTGGAGTDTPGQG